MLGMLPPAWLCCSSCFALNALTPVLCHWWCLAQKQRVCEPCRSGDSVKPCPGLWGNGLGSISSGTEPAHGALTALTALTFRGTGCRRLQELARLLAAPPGKQQLSLEPRLHGGTWGLDWPLAQHRTSLIRQLSHG